MGGITSFGSFDFLSKQQTPKNLQNEVGLTKGSIISANGDFGAQFSITLTPCSNISINFDTLEHHVTMRYIIKAKRKNNNLGSQKIYST